jgi:predicted transposase YbfD/YdcC
VKAIHTVSAYATEYGLSLAEAVVNEKTNEIPTTRDMLGVVNVEGCVVTWDALNTQKETVKRVIEKRGAYVGALKANQRNFYEDVVRVFEPVSNAVQPVSVNVSNSLYSNKLHPLEKAIYTG